jgi:hypothetical protein
MAIPMEVRLSTPWRRLSYWEAFYQAHLELPILNSFMGSSIFIVVCMTSTRFMALFRPATFRSVMGNKNARAQVTVGLAIAIATALSAPLVMLKQISCEHDDGDGNEVAAVGLPGTNTAEPGNEVSREEGLFLPGFTCRPKENTGITSRYVRVYMRIIRYISWRKVGLDLEAK